MSKDTEYGPSIFERARLHCRIYKEIKAASDEIRRNHVLSDGVMDFHASADTRKAMKKLDEIHEQESKALVGYKEQTWADWQFPHVEKVDMSKYPSEKKEKQNEATGMTAVELLTEAVSGGYNRTELKGAKMNPLGLAVGDRIRWKDKSGIGVVTQLREDTFSARFSGEMWTLSYEAIVQKIKEEKMGEEEFVIGGAGEIATCPDCGERGRTTEGNKCDECAFQFGDLSKLGRDRAREFVRVGQTVRNAFDKEVRVSELDDDGDPRWLRRAGGLGRCYANECIVIKAREDVPVSKEEFCVGQRVRHAKRNVMGVVRGLQGANFLRVCVDGTKGTVTWSRRNAVIVEDEAKFRVGQVVKHKYDGERAQVLELENIGGDLKVRTARGRRVEMWPVRRCTVVEDSGMGKAAQKVAQNSEYGAHVAEQQRRINADKADLWDRAVVMLGGLPEEVTRAGNRGNPILMLGNLIDRINDTAMTESDRHGVIVNRAHDGTFLPNDSNPGMHTRKKLIGKVRIHHGDDWEV